MKDKYCPACQRDTMHLCTEENTVLIELKPGEYLECISKAIHWHCDKCGHRLDLTPEESSSISENDYIYKPGVN